MSPMCGRTTISDRVVSASSAALRLEFLIDSIVSKDSPSGGIQIDVVRGLLILFFFLTYIQIGSNYSNFLEKRTA
jgi:hypothetical protein